MEEVSAAVVEQTSKEHKQLITLIDQLLAALMQLPSDVQWGSSQWLPDSEILDFVRLQTLSLSSTKELAVQGYYRDSYHIIRMVYEAYFLLRLITTSVKFTRLLNVKKEPQDSNLEEAKNREKQRIKDKFGEYLVGISDEGKNTLKVVLKGLRIVDGSGNYTGKMLPIYYGAWKEYRPEEYWLQKPSITRRLSVKRFLQRDWQALRRRNRPSFYSKHKYLHRVIHNFQKGLDNLYLNSVLGRKEIARVLVHYNFLSNYSHATVKSINDMMNIQKYNLIGGDGIKISYDHYHSELALLYVCHLLSMYLEHVLYYLTTWRTIKVSGERKVYRRLCHRVQDEFGYFWFIFNKPYSYDKYDDANRRSDFSRNMIYRPEDIRDGYVRYYNDPLYRLKQLHSPSGRELTTGNIYVSPFPREDV